MAEVNEPVAGDPHVWPGYAELVRLRSRPTVMKSMLTEIRSWLLRPYYQGMLGLSASLAIALAGYLINPIHTFGSVNFLAVIMGSDVVAGLGLMVLGLATIVSMHEHSIRWQVPLAVVLSMVWWFICAAAISWDPSSSGPWLFGMLGLATTWCAMRVWLEA